MRTDFGQKKVGFLKGRWKSLGYAVRGAGHLIRTEHSIMVQLAIGVMVSLAGFYFELTTWEWALQVFAIGLVLASEGLNTAIEKLCDFIQPEWDPRIGRIKDVAAGGVTFAALAAIVVGMIIYLPKVF